MPIVIDPELVEKKELKFAEKMLRNKDILREIERVYDDPSIKKLTWKEIYKIGTGKEPPEDKQRDGYYSVIFLDDEKGKRLPVLIGEKIQKGGKAVLKNAYNLETGEHIALKIVRGVTDESSKALEDLEFKQEKEGLVFFNRFNAEQSRELESSSKKYLAQQYISGTDLDGVIKKTRDQISEMSLRSEEAFTTYKSVLQIMVSFLSELSKLHEEGFVHRDIKPGNVMIVLPDAMLIDFGSMDRNPGSLSDPGSGTANYLAPEIKKSEEGKVRFTFETDVFAAGKTLEKANDLLSQTRLVAAMKVQKFSEQDLAIKKEIGNLIEKMTAVDPTERVTAKQALEKLSVILSNKEYARVAPSANISISSEIDKPAPHFQSTTARAASDFGIKPSSLSAISDLNEKETTEKVVVEKSTKISPVIDAAPANDPTVSDEKRSKLK